MTRENLLVVYCDGSARPTNPGFAGYGLFGYVLKDTEKPRNINYPVRGAMRFTSRGIIQRTRCKAFTEPMVGGKSITRNLDNESFECLDIIEVIASLQSEQGTNNQAELMAANEAMQIALEREDVNRLLVITDSEYVVAGGLGRLDNWIKNGWRTSSGKEVSNIDLWREFDTLRRELQSNNIELDFRWVKGHIGEEGNEIVDVYAVIGAVRARVHRDDYDSLDTIDKHYVKQTTSMTDFRKEIAEAHPIYDYRSMMFYSKYEEDLANVAVLINCKEPTDLGKRSLDNSYALLVNDIPSEIKQVREAFCYLPRNQENLSRINLDIVRQDKLFLRHVSMLGYLNTFNPIEERLRSPRFQLGPVIHFPQNGKKKDDDKKEKKPQPPVLVEEYNRHYAFLTETEDTINLLNKTADAMTILGESGQLLDITSLIYNHEEKDPMVLKFRDREIDLTDHIKRDDIILVSKPVLYVGKDTPPYSFFKSVADRASNVLVHIDTKGYGNCATFVVIIVYKNEAEEPAMILHTNLLGKYLFKHKE